MRYTFQHQIATGRTTFPVAILLSLVLWILPFEEKTELLSLLACGLTTYLLIELNTTFALIHTRTELPSSLYAFLYSSTLFLHPYQTTCWMQLLAMVTLFCLFNSYESKNGPLHIFHAFLCLGISSIMVPEMIWMIPLGYISMGALRSLNLRTFFAGLMGYLLPFLGVLGYRLFNGINHPEAIRGIGFQEVVQDYFGTVFPFGVSLQELIAEYQSIQLIQGISYGIVLILSIIGSIYSIYYSYNDKVRTRSFLSAIVPLQIGITLLVFMHPSLINTFLPVLMLFGALTCSYVFALIFKRFTGYLLMFITALCIGNCLFNLWIHFFSF